MLGPAAHAKKASKFEDSDRSHMSGPRAVSELPHRPAPRVPPRLLRAPVGWEANGARHRGLLAAGRGTPPPRSLLHEKKPAGAGAAEGSRAVELEAKLGKAHDQLAGMREQLAAAEKARKDARSAFAEAKKRAAAKKRDRVVASTWAPPVGRGDDSMPAEQKQQDAQVLADGHEEMRRRSSSATDVLGPSLPETENSVAHIVADGDAKMKGNPEADELIRAKLAAKDKEAYELRAKLMVKDMEIHDLRAEVAAKDADFDELLARLVAKDAETAALGAHNAHLMKTAEEAAKARGIAEQALRESAAREARLAERLGASERAREALDAEARRVRVQSEQWRKAAEEAAAVLGAGAGVGGNRRIGARGGGKETRRRHGSAGSNGDGMEKRDAEDEGSGGVRTAGGSMRVLTDLWRKKVQK